MKEAQGRELTRREMLSASAAAILAGSIGAGCAREQQDKPLNVLIYLADTLRSDHLSCYGYPISTSPYFDRTASEWCVFETCRSHASWTKPSVTSMFTGAAPLVHKVSTGATAVNGAQRSQMLPANIPTIAERLRDAGYATGWFLANEMMRPELGFGRGFEHHHFKPLEDAADQRKAVEQWIAARAERPFYAFVHQMDPHGPYRPHDASFQTLFGKSQDEAAAELIEGDRAAIESYYDYYDHPSPDTIPARQRNMARLTRLGQEHLQRLYDAETRYVVDQFGLLVEFLRGKGLLENTVVIFTSDHGEAFNEHGRYLHGYEPYEEVIRVPFIVRDPRGKLPERVSTPIGHVDMAATVLALTGARPMFLARGQTLVAPNGELPELEIRPQMAWTLRLDNLAQSDGSFVLRDYKLLSYRGGQAFLLFNLVADPRETRELGRTGVSLDAAPFRQLVAQFNAIKEADLNLARAVDEPQWWTPDDDHIEEMRALGYL